MMLHIKNNRPMATVTAGLLACTVAFGCSKKDDQARNDAAVNAGYGDSAKAAAPADTTLRGSQGGTVSGTTPLTRDDSARVAHSPAPGERADASLERRPATAPTAATPSTRRYTDSQSGNVAPRRNTEISRATTPRRSADANVTVSREDNGERAPLRDTTAGIGNATGAAPGAAAINSITADPQVVTVVLLANIGDSGRAVRMCLNPASTGNSQLRDYVQQEIRDHAQFNARVVQLVRQKNIIPTRSPVGDQIFQRNQDMPRADESVRDFMAREARLHQDMITAIDQQLLPSVQDTALRSLLNEGRQMVQAHLTRATQFQSTAANQPATSLNTPSYSMSAQPAAGASTPNAPATRDSANKPANLSPAYGETTTVRVTPPSASASATPNSASVTARPPSASVTTTPNYSSVSATPPSASVTVNNDAAPIPADCAPAAVNQPAPGVQPSYQYQQNNLMRPDTTRGFDSRVRSDTLRVVPSDTARTRPDTTRARPTPPRP